MRARRLSLLPLPPRDPLRRRDSPKFAPPPVGGAPGRRGLPLVALKAQRAGTAVRTEAAGDVNGKRAPNSMESGPRGWRRPENPHPKALRQLFGTATRPQAGDWRLVPAGGRRAVTLVETGEGYDAGS